MYKYNGSDRSVIRLADGMNIPYSKGNADYEEFLKWYRAGNRPESSLMDTRPARKAQIDAERDQKLLAGVTWQGNLWQTSTSFQAHLTSIVGAYAAGILPETATTAIRTQDNQVVDLSGTQVRELAGTVLGYVQAVFNESWFAKDALESSSVEQGVPPPDEDLEEEEDAPIEIIVIPLPEPEPEPVPEPAPEGT